MSVGRGDKEAEGGGKGWDCSFILLHLSRVSITVVNNVLQEHR